MEVDPEQETDEGKYVETETSRLNFYKPDGTRLTAADLKIEDLANPGNGYLAEILDTGELTLFIEGAEKFGLVGTYLEPVDMREISQHPKLKEGRDLYLLALAVANEAKSATFDTRIPARADRRLWS